MHKLVSCFNENLLPDHVNREYWNDTTPYKSRTVSQGVEYCLQKS